MELSKVDVEKIVDVYLRAWTSQDPELACSIFTDNASYREGGFAEPMLGSATIRSYWQKKVVEGQHDISCERLNVYLDANTAIVEWQAEFDDLEDLVRKRIREVAIIEFEGELISSLREYWSSQRLSNLAP